MKRRLFAALLSAVVLFCTTSFAFAENDQTQESKVLFEPIPEDDNTKAITTGTQVREAEKEDDDADEDIRDQIEDLIPDNVEEIKIGTAGELIEFSKKCSLDTWSANKMVVLTDDIDLLGVKFNGIPYFGGIFDGRGHTIKELDITDSLSYAGLFSYVQKDAVVKNLNVEGAVVPSGSNLIIGGIVGDNYGIIRNCSFKGIIKGVDYIGGIVGINEVSGEIDNCTSSGYIDGTHFCGGISGENMGNITGCTNNCAINTTVTDIGISIDSMETINAVLNLIKNGLDNQDKPSADVTVTDIGGISGLSIGIITRCINNGEIGYDHVGYNVGGIAGRQSGYILSCSNNGLIKGRKDVGGIAGQAEPYITVDLGSDIAYQLTQSISELHDTVTATLNDAKKQSDTVSERLAVIQKFTAGAVDDTKFIATGTVDLVNGISSAANTAFSRIDYVIDEASKEGGIMDGTVSAAENVSESIKDIRDTIDDIDIYEYLSDGEKEDFDRAKEAMEIITAQESELYDAAYDAYFNEFIHQHGHNYASDLKFITSGGEILELDPNADASADLESEGSDITLYDGEFVHYESDDSYEKFPITDGSEQQEQDKKLKKLAKAHAALKATDYAKEKYVSPEGYSSNDVTEDLAAATQTITELTYRHLPDLTDAVRSDAESAANSVAGAASDLKGALRSARDLVGDIAGQDDIRLPSLDDEYRAHTASLADNMKGMNDNFGLLNSEINSSSDVLVGDLQALSDKFNDILMLYTDAIDGVLDKDYTDIISDESLAEAEYTTDATIDSCLNFGTCEGDIDTSGIAGTMAIEYDFDKESQITGLKGSKINTSFITKCVLRKNRNYGSIKGLKDYTGGICGMQEMGTVLGCGSYGNVESTNGNYVGGITGSSLSYIISSYAKGELDGMNYVGGIAGDGRNIRECLSLVTVGEAESWYGAIAGHVDDAGEVRENYFVSDELAGIDRVSYSLKAEPVSYEDVLNNRVFGEFENETKDEEGKVVALSSAEDENKEKEYLYRSIPDEFNSFIIRFILVDEDIDGGSTEIGRLSKKYGDSVKKEDYPPVTNKDGYYVVWDTDRIDNISADMTINATYKRYRTTISVDRPSDNIHRSDLLVDGNFREGDELKVVRTVLGKEDQGSDEAITLYEKLDVTVPDDGSKNHRIRFRPQDDAIEIIGKIGKYTDARMILFMETESGIQELKPVDKMGAYDIYEIDGNSFHLIYGYKGFNKLGNIMFYAVVAVVVIILLLLILNIYLFIKHRNKATKMIADVKEKVTSRIDSKEQRFYDDSKDDVKAKEKAKDKEQKSEEKEAESKEKAEETEIKEEPEKTEPKEEKNNSELTEKQEETKAKEEKEDPEE